MDKLIIAGKEFNSRLFLGTGKFNSNDLMEKALLASGTEMVTVAMKRIDLEDKENGVIIIKWKNPTILYPSEFLKLIISSTIEVDVKDNKFRYIVSGGQVNVSPNIGDPSRMATSSIYLAQNDINFVLGLINNNEKIIIDNDFVDKVNNYKQKVDSLPKYKNEKKNKLSDDWEDANRKYQILNNMFATFKETNQALVNSLKEALVANDNW